MKYSPILEAQIGAWAESMVPSKRIKHIRGVVTTAAQLAEHYAPHEAPRVRVAGWIHDVAKSWNPEKLLAYAEQHDLPITPAEQRDPTLLHGAIGYELANERFDLNDGVLRDACALHTYGAPGMSIAAKIVFIADLAEPARKKKRARKLRAAMFDGLDQALLLAVGSVLRHLVKRRRPIDPRGLALYNDLITPRED